MLPVDRDTRTKAMQALRAAFLRGAKMYDVSVVFSGKKETIVDDIDPTERVVFSWPMTSGRGTFMLTVH